MVKSISQYSFVYLLVVQNVRRIRSKTGGKLACRRDCLRIRVDGRRGSAGQQCGWESAVQWPGAERPAIALLTGEGRFLPESGAAKCWAINILHF